MTRRFMVTVTAVVELPDDREPADYLRAVGNYVADWAPASVPKEGQPAIKSAKSWAPGRGVTVDVSMEVERQPAFENAQFADLPAQAALL